MLLPRHLGVGVAHCPVSMPHKRSGECLPTSLFSLTHPLTPIDLLYNTLLSPPRNHSLNTSLHRTTTSIRPLSRDHRPLQVPMCKRFARCGLMLSKAHPALCVEVDVGARGGRIPVSACQCVSRGRLRWCVDVLSTTGAVMTDGNASIGVESMRVCTIWQAHRRGCSLFMHATGARSSVLV